MPNYRLFFIGQDEHIIRAEVADCPSDGDAVAVARVSCQDYRAVEVWDLTRQVKRVDAVEHASNHVS